MAVDHGSQSARDVSYEPQKLVGEVTIRQTSTKCFNSFEYVAGIGANFPRTIFMMSAGMPSASNGRRSAQSSNRTCRESMSCSECYSRGLLSVRREAFI